MSCPMCGKPEVVDGFCCEDHREIAIREEEAMSLRHTLLEIVALGEEGSWYVEMARQGHLRSKRTSV